jgi:hypothetical protein
MGRKKRKSQSGSQENRKRIISVPGLKAWLLLRIRCSLINSLLSGIFEFARAREPNVSDCTICRCVIDAV